MIYPKSLEPLTVSTLGFLEEAYEKVGSYFDFRRSSRTVVILTDNQDLANGLTLAIGHQGLVLYTVGPDPYTAIFNTSHWMRSLVFHEFAHYAIMTKTRGLYTLGRFLFGDVILPNGLWPTWLTEGAATYIETVFSDMGRGNGPYFQTLLKDSVDQWLKANQDAPPKFNEFMGAVPHFPFGETAYFAGYGIVDEVSHQYGNSFLRDLAHKGAAAFPFFPNTLASSAAGADISYQDIWKSWIQRHAEMYGNEIKKLNQLRLDIEGRWEEPGASRWGHRFSPDEEWLAVVEKSGHELTHLKLLPGKKGQDTSPQWIDQGYILPQLSWSEDQTELLYTKVDFQDPFHLYGDLYVYRLAQKKVTRLTRGSRAKDACFCGPGHLAFTRNVAGRGEVVLFDRNTEKERVLASLPSSVFAHTPRCPQDGSYVYFVAKDHNPLGQIWRIRATSSGPSSTQPVLSGQSSFGALFPEVSADGQQIWWTYQTRTRYALATSTINPQTGTPQGPPRLLAQGPRGYWFPQWLPRSQRLAATELSSQSIAPVLFSQTQTQQDQDWVPETLPASSDFGPSTRAASPPAVASKESPYRFYRSMLPRIWSPTFVLYGGRWTAGGYIQGWDDVDQLRYAADLYHDSVKNGPNGSFALFHRLPGGFRLSTYGMSRLDSWSLDHRSGHEQNQYAEEWSAGGTLSRPFPKIFSVWEPFIQLEWARVHFEGPSWTQYNPGELRTGLGVVFDSRQSVAYSVTAETGQLLVAQAQNLRTLNKEDNYVGYKTLVRYQPRFRLGPPHGVLSTEFDYAFAPNPKRDLYSSYVQLGGSASLSRSNIPLRGYPTPALLTRQAFAVKAEYTLPVVQIFRGPGTWPFFFKNLGLSWFGELAKAQYPRSHKYSPLLSSLGASLQLNMLIGYLSDTSIRLEFSRGLRQDFGGENQVAINLGLLP